MRLMTIDIRLGRDEKIADLLRGLPKFLTATLNRDVQYFIAIKEEQSASSHGKYDEGLARDGGAGGV